MQAFAEYERKLDAPNGFELPELGGEPLESRIFRSFYYDTDDFSLARAGITLRRRLEGGKSTWQLKLPQAEDRLEIGVEGGPAGPPVELARLLIAHTRHSALAPVAELRTRRRGKLVETSRVSAEVTVDEVAVMDALRVADEFVEVEVEVRSGDRKDIDRIVRELEHAGASAGNGRPKLFRVLDVPNSSELLEGSREGLARLQALLREQLTEILANDPGTRLGSDLESVHDMRVAVRRSRALLRVGRKLTVTNSERLRSELKWLGGILGVVRDLDVLLAHLSGEIAKLPADERRAASPLLTSLKKQHRAARGKLIKGLDSARYFRLLDLLDRTVTSLEPAPNPVKLDQLAHKELNKLRQAIDELGADPSDADLHERRKRSKRVRYTAELAGDKSLVKRAKRFQDVLGEHQDAVVAEQQLRRLAPAVPSPTALAAGRLIERESRRAERTRLQWPKVWRKLDRMR